MALYRHKKSYWQTIHREKIDYVLRSYSVGDNGSVIFKNQLANVISIFGADQEWKCQMEGGRGTWGEQGSQEGSSS